MENLLGIIGNPSKIRTPRVIQWLQQSKASALVWTAMRVWLGVMWIQAGVAKLWGAESQAFMHSGGAGVVGFATHGVPAYSWWGSFLHSFVVPNAGWIGVTVAISEFVIGICLAFGFLTPFAALASLALLFTYVMSGTASVCAFYALFAIVILATWRTSSWIGVDGVISGYRQRHASPGEAVQAEEHPEVVAALKTLDATTSLEDALPHLTNSTSDETKVATK
ncbi:MAG: DoxX family protein [Acidimicrobiales bacterium]